MRRKVHQYIVGPVILGIVFWGWAGPADAVSDWSFDLLPAGGAVAGPPGSTVGWGYRIANAAPNAWLMITGLSPDPVVHATPDGSIFDFPILGPATTVEMPYDGIHGLYTLTWDLGAPTGFANHGTFILSAEWYDGDPFGAGLVVEAAPDHTAEYLAVVTQAPATTVPEPSTLFLLGVGVVGLVWIGPRRASLRPR